MGLTSDILLIKVVRACLYIHYLRDRSCELLYQLAELFKFGLRMVELPDGFDILFGTAVEVVLLAEAGFHRLLIVQHLGDLLVNLVLLLPNLLRLDLLRHVQ